MMRSDAIRCQHACDNWTSACRHPAPHSTRSTGGASQALSSTACSGQYSRKIIMKGPSGAGNQFASFPSPGAILLDVNRQRAVRVQLQCPAASAN